MARDGDFALSVRPDIVLAAVTQEVPAELAKLLFQIVPLHKKECTRIRVRIKPRRAPEGELAGLWSSEQRPDRAAIVGQVWTGASPIWGHAGTRRVTSGDP